MAGLAVSGLVTGLDTERLIQQLLALERRPVALLEARRARLASVAEAFRDLAARLETLRARAVALQQPNAVLARRAVSSAETVATAAATAGDLRGTFALTVEALARGSVATGSGSVAAASDPIAAGDGVFSFQVGAGDPVSISVTATTTLADLVAAINASGAGVRAAAVNLGSAAAPAWTLTLASTTTGAASTVTVLADDTTLQVTTTQAGADARFTVAGIGTFTRPGNTVADVLEGVTITLRAPGTTEISLEVDRAAVRAAVQGLVDAYNEVVRALDSQSRTTRAADGTVSPGAFSGDVLPRTLRQGLAAVLATPGPGRYPVAAAIGVSSQRDGTLALDGERLERALAEDPEAVRDLLAGTAVAEGLADRLVTRARAAVAPGTGLIAARQDGLAQSLRSLDRQIADALARLERTEQALRARFAGLEQAVARLQQTSTFLAGQLRLLQGGAS